jgi:hypothetical protein
VSFTSQIIFHLSQLLGVTTHGILRGLTEINWLLRLGVAPSRWAERMQAVEGQEQARQQEEQTEQGEQHVGPYPVSELEVRARTLRMSGRGVLRRSGE